MPISFPVDNSFLNEYILIVKQGGEYRMLPFKMPQQGVCDSFTKVSEFYQEMADGSDLPSSFQCPILAVRKDI